MSEFSVSVLIPALDEERALAETLDALQADPQGTIAEIVVVVCDRTTPGCRRTIAEHASDRVRVCEQQRGRLGGAYIEGLAGVRGSHVLMMFADLESSPETAHHMIAMARQQPETIVSASRWLPNSRFDGYGRVKLVANYLFQKASAIAFSSSVTDFTFGFRLYPVRVLQDLDLSELGHAFVYEAILKPVRRGIPVREVPTVWKARDEGVPRSHWALYRSYVRVAWQVRTGGR